MLPPTAPDFSDPLGLLGACHQRILGHCELLERLPAWLTEHGADAEAAAAAHKVIRYFSTAGRHHHADEEQDLFPLLAAFPELAGAIGRLPGEHRQLDASWDRLQPELQRIGDGRPGTALAAALAPAITAFVAASRAHIDLENRDILPAARRLLSQPQLDALGRAMAARRGVSRTE